MSNQTRIATIRGAGLAFPVACLWYLFSGNLSVFFLVLCGAGTGFLVGQVLQKSPAVKSKLLAVFKHIDSQPERQGVLMKYLANPNPFIRFVSFMGVGTLLFLLAWCIGYYFLPAGAFHGGAEAHMVRGQLTAQSTSVFEEWTKIFKANLLVALIILLGSLLIRVNGLSFGYFAVFYNVIGYGLFVGTNSFAIPYPERMAPSFEILSRSGPYEMAALSMLAAATYFWPLFQIKRIFLTSPERVDTPFRFSWKDAIGVALGLAVLGAANWIEAAMAMSV
jgi:hypothetical protein